MEYLRKTDIPLHVKYIDAAIAEAQESSCRKSKRGVVIAKNNAILAVGHNDPPEGWYCKAGGDDLRCRDRCNKYTVHAEQNAIFNGLLARKNLRDSTMYHMKIKDGKVTPVPLVEENGCVECSKLIVQIGIAGMILQHAEGYAHYSSQELHRLSLLSLDKLNS